MNPKTPTEDTLAIIMGGGAGTRLFPLQKNELNQPVPIDGGSHNGWHVLRVASQSAR
jgi:hypothetical protein